jgi:hypothetical protein
MKGKIRSGRLAIGVMALGLAASLGACTGPTAQQTRAGADARATASPLGTRTADWGSGVRSQSPGYLYDRSGGA